MAAVAPTGPRAVRLRAGVGVHRGQGAPLLRDVGQARHIHKGISRGDHSSHRAECRRSLQLEDCRRPGGRRRAPSVVIGDRFGRVARAVSGHGGIRQEELPGADPEGGELRCIDAWSGERMELVGEKGLTDKHATRSRVRSRLEGSGDCLMTVRLQPAALPGAAGAEDHRPSTAAASAWAPVFRVLRLLETFPADEVMPPSRGATGYVNCLCRIEADHQLPAARD